MATTVILPKDKADLEKTIKRMLNTGTAARNRRMVSWLISYHYLQGARDFSNPNWQTGTVLVNMGRTNSAGYKDFRYEEVVSRYQTELGRMLKIDLSPKVKKKGIGLDSLRKSSIAQIALDNMVPQATLEKAKADILPLLLTYGSAGVSVWVDKKGVPHLEISPPWELLPIPCEPMAAVDSKGLMRVRWMSVDRLKEFELSGPKGTLRPKWGEMESKEVPYGTTPPSDDNPTSALSLFTVVSEKTDNLTNSGKGGQGTQEFVQIAELWLEGSSNTLARYILCAGGQVIVDSDYTEEERQPPMPAKKVSYIDTGAFYGRGFVEILIPVNDEVENLLSRLFENIQELDLFGILLVPGGQGIKTSELRASGKPKYLQYEPDYNVPTHKPDRIAPVNTGALPGKIAEMAMGLMNNLANQTEMLRGEAPGRVDSARGLGMLFETASISLTGPAMALAEGFVGAYRAMLELAKEKWSNMDISAISMLDDSVIGVTLNPTSGALDVQKNALPLPEEVNITVASAAPVSPEQQKAELANSLQLQVITPREYRIMARTKGLDLPVGNTAEWENYRKAVWENLVMFGDGEKPGEALVAENDLHPEHLETLNAFRAKPEFQYASPEVRMKFAKHDEEHRRGLGTGYPEEMPYPEDQAQVDDMAGGFGGLMDPGGQQMAPPQM